MALTEAQEKELLEGFGGLKKTVADLQPIAAKVPELEKTIQLKDAQIAELTKKTNDLSVNGELSSLKTAYPDVPEATILAVKDLPAEKRSEILKPAQESAAKLKADAAKALAKSDPVKGWEHAGDIGPSTDAERAAEQAASKKRYVEQAKDGNVFGMLQERSAEIVAHVRKAFVHA